MTQGELLDARFQFRYHNYKSVFNQLDILNRCRSGLTELRLTPTPDNKSFDVKYDIDYSKIDAIQVKDLLNENSNNYYSDSKDEAASEILLKLQHDFENEESKK